MTNRVWSGGNSGDWTVDSNWSPNGVPAGGDTAIISSGGVVVSGLTLDGLTISLGTAGTSTSSVVLSASAVTMTSSTDIVVAAGGTAALVLSGTVTNSGTITDSGSGTILRQSGALHNPGAILVEDGATYVMSGAVSNVGTITESGSGTRLFQSGALINPGSVLVENGATYVMSGAVTNAGTITEVGSGTKLFQSGALDNTSAILVEGGATYVISGALSNDGTIVVNGGTLFVSSGGSLSGAGEPASIDVGSGGSVEVYGQVTSGQSFAFTDSTGVITIQSSAGFDATITAIQSGDYIFLPTTQATSAVLSGGFITVSGTTASGTPGIVAQYSTTAPDNAVTFYTRDDGFGTLLLTSDETRIWNSTSGNWTDATDWTTSGVAGAGAPLTGDNLFIDSGTATLDAQAGMVAASTIHLDGKSFLSPGTLMLQSATLAKTTAIVVDGGSGTTGQILVGGTDVVGGTVSAGSLDGLLFVVGADSGGATDDTIVVNGAVVATTEAGVAFSNVTVQNNGLIDVYGGMSFDSSAPLTGSGVVEIEDGGTVGFGGTVVDTQQIVFSSTLGELLIADPSGSQGVTSTGFNAQITNYQQGDIIDLVGLSGATASYSSASSELTVSAGGQAYYLNLSLNKTTTRVVPVFSASDDGNGGTDISYTTKPITADVSMPVAVVGAATQMVSFDQILKDAFGTDQLPFTEFTFSAQANSTIHGGTVIANSGSTSTATSDPFWGQPQQTPSSNGIYPSWYLNGVSSTTFTATLAEIQSGGVMFEVGNSIVSTAEFSVTDPNNQQVTNYHMWGVDPGASTSSSGVTPTSSTEISSIEQFNQFYSSNGLPDVINSEDCPWIADDVAAGGGATMPWQDNSTDPNENESGGFWRIVYNGDTSGGTVGNNWYQYLQAGDVVRMGWAGTNNGTLGHHTTTILSVLPTSGTSATAVSVWDDNYDYEGTSYIGLHDATYWDSTVPQSITIYRIDPNGQYLISGHTSGETILGNDFNDLIQPVGGGAVIQTGTSATEIQGIGTNLNGTTLTGFETGDTFDVTDLASGSVSYDQASGVLTMGAGSSSTVINLVAGLPGTFAAAGDGANGTIVSYVACYCHGTLIAVPGGECPVERLCIGDNVLTLDGQARPVRWIGRRTYAGRFLAANPGVHPVRFSAGSLGDGLPRRDLLVSPEHAMFLDGILVPARCLMNGTAIVRERGLDRVDYFHIELESHDILLAEGAPSESYLDDDSRMMFENATEYSARYPDAPPPGQFCAPRKEDGFRLEAVRRRLAGVSREIAEAA